jgi:hypothetical protein
VYGLLKSISTILGQISSKQSTNQWAQPAQPTQPFSSLHTAAWHQAGNKTVKTLKLYNGLHDCLYEIVQEKYAFENPIFKRAAEMWTHVGKF